MDNAGFSLVSEDPEPEQLIALATDSTQAMCDVIEDSSGTLDKVLPLLGCHSRWVQFSRLLLLLLLEF